MELIRRLLCRYFAPWPFYFWHKFRLIQCFDESTRKIQCVHCDQYFAMSDRHQSVVPWDDEFETICCMIYNLPRTLL